MKRRNSEREHWFSKEVAKACGIYDMQGLLIGGGKFTAAVEAFEWEEEDNGKTIYEAFFPQEEMYIKCAFAKAVGVPFYILLHRGDEPFIYVYHMETDGKYPQCKISRREKWTEEEFLHWWARNKTTLQQKAYRPALVSRVGSGYFDNLLESHGMKWGGNVDGFVFRQGGIRGLIENRVTTKNSILTYDPGRFFRYGGGDYMTWMPLFQLRSQLNVPLILCTYSNYQAGEQHCMGMAVLDSLTESGISYAPYRDGHGKRPCDNLSSGVEEAASRIFQICGIEL